MLYVLILDHIMDPLTAFCNSDFCPLCEAVFLFRGVVPLRCAFCAACTGTVQSFKLEKGTIDLLLQFFRMTSMKLVKEFLISGMSQARSVIFFHGFSMNFRCVGPMLISLM